ncbi:MAG: ribbon-helix-helix domain-containing protein [Rhizobiales bacterium]|nr:ribbon-helix-helix domain-containing protein [Hyphomicrobiales bacterium]
MSPIRKRSVTIRGHRTSYSLEDAFQDELENIASARSMPLAALIARIDEGRPRDTNLSSALRLFVLEAVRKG